jgi:hypothetical protein
MLRPISARLPHRQAFSCNELFWREVIRVALAAAISNFASSRLVCKTGH